VLECVSSLSITTATHSVLLAQIELLYESNCVKAHCDAGGVCRDFERLASLRRVARRRSVARPDHTRATRGKRKHVRGAGRRPRPRAGGQRLGTSTAARERGVADTPGRGATCRSAMDRIPHARLGTETEWEYAGPHGACLAGVGMDVRRWSRTRAAGARTTAAPPRAGWPGGAAGPRVRTGRPTGCRSAGRRRSTIAGARSRAGRSC
jgi:hypothetical protein